MLCFSPGKQLPLFSSRLCFSKEEKTVVKRAPRGSPAVPTSARAAGWETGPGSTASQGRVAGRRGPGPAQASELGGKRGRWQGCSRVHRWGRDAPGAQEPLPLTHADATRGWRWGEHKAVRGWDGMAGCLKEVTPGGVRAGWADRQEGRRAGSSPQGSGEAMGVSGARGSKGAPRALLRSSQNELMVTLKWPQARPRPTPQPGRVQAAPRTPSRPQARTPTGRGQRGD